MLAKRKASLVSDDFKKSLLNEYRSVIGRLVEAQAEVAALNPVFQQMAALVKTLGLDGEIEKLLDDDNIQQFPDAAKAKGQTIRGLVEAYLCQHGNRYTRLSELFQHLLDSGVQVSGKNPNSTLSAHLSQGDRFENDRARGWRLKPQYYSEVSLSPAASVSGRKVTVL